MDGKRENKSKEKDQKIMKRKVQKMDRKIKEKVEKDEP